MTTSQNEEPRADELTPTRTLPTGATLQDATEWMRSCGVIADAVQAGEMVPDFELPDAHGVSVALGALLDHGPVIITFVLGSCSPLCRASLRALQGALPGIEACHGTLVAISPEPPARLRALADEDGLKFPMLADNGHHLGSLFGLAYQPPEPVCVWLNLLGFATPPETMPSHLVLPATYVVDSEGIAIFAFLEPDLRRRADPRQVTACLSRMLRSSAGRQVG